MTYSYQYAHLYYNEHAITDLYAVLECAVFKAYVFFTGLDNKRLNQ